MVLGKCSSENNTIRRKKKKVALSYGLTIGFTILTLFVVTFYMKIYPFGDQAYMWTDADQYFGIEHYFGTILGVNDIFYSWGNVLGGNALSQLSYYSFSPFNILFILFHNHMIFAVHVVAYLKIVVSALTFCFSLNYFYNDNHYLMKSLVSASYAFMGYMVFYGWNISWMDGVIILPIMLVGLYEISRGNSILCYTFSLAYALISNFYIGYMLCIISLIFYVAITLKINGKFWIGVKRTFLRYALASLLGVGLGAFLLVPTYLGLPSTRKLTLSDSFNEMSLAANPADILSGLFTGQMNSLSNNAPLIYVGIFAVILDILFLVCRRVNRRKKMISAAVILSFVFSFQNSFINKIWHGLSNNAWFNYRYSFALSFVFLIMAYESYVLLRKGKYSKSDYLLSGGILLTIVLFVEQNANGKIQMQGFSLDVLLSGVFIALLVRGYHHKKYFEIYLTACVVFSLICNSCLYLKNYELMSIPTYEENKDIMEDAFETINDSSFYRMDKSFIQGRCDGNLFDYRGVTNYSSTENVEIEDFLKRLGVQHNWMAAQYNTNMPMAAEALLGLKYVLSDTINGKDYEKIGGSQNINYYKNPYAIPILFPVSTITNFNMDGLNGFDILNTIWKSVNGIDENVFDRADVVNRSADEQKKLSVTIKKTGSAYLYIPYGSYTTIKILGASQYRELSYNYEQEIYYVGEFNEGDYLEIFFETKDGNYNLDSIICCTENREALQRNSEYVNQQDIDIQEISSSHLEMEYTGEGTTISTTIPFDKGWKIYDNGEQVADNTNWNHFLAFQIDNTGTHHIELIYRPVGYYKGLTISVVSFVLLTIYVTIRFYKKGDKQKIRLWRKFAITKKTDDSKTAV